MSTKAIVFGATGQDGSFIVDKLLDRGLTVVACVRKTSSGDLRSLQRSLDLEKNRGRLILEWFDLKDPTSIYRIIASHRPAYIYNEADQDHVGWSYKIPSYSVQVTLDSVINILEAVRLTSPSTKVFLPVSSNIFGSVNEGAVTEESKIAPVSPYGIAKAAVKHLADFYRETYDLQLIAGILFNHESMKRSHAYLSRKLVEGVLDIASGQSSQLLLGDLDTELDWGCAEEFSEILIRLMESDFNGAVVVGTGQLTSVRELVGAAFDVEGLSYEEFVVQDPALMRPVKMAPIYADTSLLERCINTKPLKNGVDVILGMLSEAKL